MKGWIFLFGAALAVAPAPLCAQKGGAITITGELAGVPDSATVAIFEPLPGLPLNYFFTEGLNEAVVRNGRFTYQLRHGQTGFVRFQGNNAPSELVFVEPGAHIALVMRKSGGNEPPVPQFTGTNAAANTLLAKRQLLNGGPADGQRFATVLAAAPTAAAVLQALQGELKKPNAQLSTAYQKREISKRCYDALTAETEQRLLFWAGGALMGHFTDSARANLHLKMPRNEARKLVADLFKRYDPTLPRYRYSALGNTVLLAGFRQKGVLPWPLPATHIWGRYEKEFAPVASNMGQYDYLPASEQSHAIGTLLLTALAFNAMSEAECAAVFADYRRLFPTSNYVAVVVRALNAQKAKAQPAAVAGQNVTLGRFEAGTQALIFSPAPGLDTLKTLASLVRQQFRGRPVFVDFWASWCGPCIAEFRHEAALHDFLSQNGIDVLYVSVDQPGFREKWAALAIKYNLRGHHYLASPEVQESLKPLVPYIPRYMLFDKSGALVEASAYHPSDGEKLYQQLRERLKAK